MRTPFSTVCGKSFAMALVLLSSLLSNSSFAQKPSDRLPFELIPPTEEAYDVIGDMRVIRRTGQPIALYNVNFVPNPATPAIRKEQLYHVARCRLSNEALRRTGQ